MKNEINEKIKSEKGKYLKDSFEKLIKINFDKITEDNSEIILLSIKFWKLYYEIFSLRDCLSFLGIRSTPGSADYFPPIINTLLEGFCTLNSVIDQKNQNESEIKSKNNL